MKTEPSKLNIVVLAVFIAIALVALPPGALATEKAAATSFIDGLSDTVFKVLQSKDLSLAQKEVKVRSLLSDNLDLRHIGKFVLGSSWRKASLAQRKEYFLLFRKHILASYTRRLVGYSGNKPQVIGATPIGKKDILVITNIDRDSGPPIEAAWRVRSAQGEHKILDVVVAGISWVVTLRSEFRSVVRRQGFDGLIKALRIQVAKGIQKK